MPQLKKKLFSSRLGYYYRWYKKVILEHFNIIIHHSTVALRQKKGDCEADMGIVGVHILRNLVDFPWHDTNNDACDIHTTV
jgi:hypothetical protein